MKPSSLPVEPRRPTRSSLVSQLSRLLVGFALVGGVAAGCHAQEGGGPPSAFGGECGNAVCEPSESCASCESDCGACSETCGNGVCDEADSCATCPADCGTCSCGNGVCDEAESCADCPEECGSCPTSCGDGTCEASECGTCAADCGTCPAVCGASCTPTCGDGVCATFKEDSQSCPKDCGAPDVCGDGTCADTESCSSCAADCCPNCGDGTCDGDEDCGSCGADCGACVCGDGECAGAETCGSCPDDCPCDTELCGDGQCGPTETCADCPADCAATSACVGYDPTKLVVYTVNYQSLMSPSSAGDASCQGQWTELLDKLASGHVAPDVLLVQEIGGKGVPGGIQAIQQQLMQRFPKDTFKALVAEDDPAPWSEASCPAGARQTNAIVYREKRLLLVPETRQTLMAKQSSGGDCVESKLSRHLGVFARFADLLAGKTTKGYEREVAIGSVHWPSDPSCGEANARDTDELLRSYGGAHLLVWGGGVDLPDQQGGTPLPWYGLVNADLEEPESLGYTDVVWESCDAEGWGPCTEENATFGSERLDYLFFKPGPSVEPLAAEEAGLGDAVTFDADPNENGLPYSGHRAIAAEIQP